VSQQCIGQLRAILAALIMLNGGDVAMSEDAREAASVSAWVPRNEVRAFYSGHSLSEGVPEVIEQGQDADHEWLVTVALPGVNAVDPRWRNDPEATVRAVGEGLRALHDSLPVAECRWSWSPEWRIGNAAERGVRVASDHHAPPPVDRLVVCHGDACMPNTLLDDAGRPLAHVDLAALGVADRWADIAVASMSTEWNVGAGWADALIDAYGIVPDRERLEYYRRLWNET
jgi:kanamycin kinase